MYLYVDIYLVCQRVAEYHCALYEDIYLYFQPSVMSDKNEVR